ncbi:hypothetical protein [Paramicrobacterium chengjingii]|uniref:DUF2510 domain-containing protein n=1 Tax=Paramicrobacterium chengjingii TaxID=2769067 RepID=A0ABX6YLZ0_9MICO|nr:hypothetical protein [Microbacterium chengjingii]QPZ39685.1 hypothetical protein HCR76_06470 [Microbacterium chengjingii]
MTEPSDYFTDETGVNWRWDGHKWIEHSGEVPLTNLEPTGEWREHGADLWRWWSGKGWSDLYVAKDGRIDLGRKIGQDIIAVYALGGVDDNAISLLRQKLSTYPPVRIVTMTPYTSSVAPGTNLVAVVEWDGPVTAGATE